MKCISLVSVFCLLHLASAVCECSNGQQSVIPSIISLNPPSPFNGTDGSSSSFGSGCIGSSLLLCANNTDNPLFDCSASNNSYYGWDSDTFSLSSTFASHCQSMNILVTFLISTSSNVSAPMSLHYGALDDGQGLPADPVIHLPTNLPEGPYQHNYTLSSGVIFDNLVITIYRNTTFQWVAINRIVLCPVTTEDQSSSTMSFPTPVTSSAMSTPDQFVSTSLTVSPTMSPAVSTTSSSVPVMSPVVSLLPNMSSTMSPSMTSIVSTVVSSSDDNDSVKAAIIGAVVGTVFLTIVIIIIIIVIVMIVCRRRKKSRRADDNNVQLSFADLPHQHTHNNSADKQDRTSRLETVNALYIPTKVKSLDSLLKRIDDRSGIGVTITPNPSYSRVGSQNGKELEYDYVQTDDGLIGHDKVVTSGEVYDEVTDVTMDTVNIDPNPAYSVGQDVKLEDNPSYSYNYSN